MVPQLEQSVELKRSVELAQRIQQSLLPQHPPDIKNVAVFGQSRYCDATGGDYYDFAEAVSDGIGRTIIAIGDVTGHGLGAALLMCTSRAALRAAAQSEQSLGRLLTHVNTVLTQDAVEDLFMTMTLMTIDPDTRCVRYACAAHDPIMVLDPKSGELTELAEGSIPLGAMPGIDYEEYQYSGVPAGAIIFIGTDGIWEARSPDDEMFGKERMVASIQRSLALSPREIGQAVESDLEKFLRGRKIQDDVTYVVLKLEGE
jgi:sigma-B regulation protein RsbU (phosphoserine phosphatase)